MRLLHLEPPEVMNIKKIRRLMKKCGLFCSIRQANPYRQMARAMSGTELAYFSDNKLFVTRLEAVEQISIGTAGNGYLDIVTTPTGVGFKWRS